MARIYRQVCLLVIAQAVRAMDLEWGRACTAGFFLRGILTHPRGTSPSVGSLRCFTMMIQGPMQGCNSRYLQKVPVWLAFSWGSPAPSTRALHVMQLAGEAPPLRRRPHRAHQPAPAAQAGAGLAAGRGPRAPSGRQERQQGGLAHAALARAHARAAGPSRELGQAPRRRQPEQPLAVAPAGGAA